MLTNIGLYSYGVALLAYSLLTALAFVARRKYPQSGLLLLASFITALWAATIAVSTVMPYPLVNLMQIAEVARNASWSFLLLKIMAERLRGTEHVLTSKRWVLWFVAAYLAVLAVLLFPPLLFGTDFINQDSYENLRFSAWLAMAIFGLLLLEQIFRNSNNSERWSIKHLCLGLGVMFAYDFFMYAEALLFRELDSNLWQARGIVISLTAIFTGVAMSRLRHPENNRNIYLSRHVVFHSVTLLAAGIYLILMALAGYFISHLGGSWGGVLQIIFLCAAGLLLLALLFSGQIRARTRVWLSKNFFSYKYDYRTEWLQFTQTLAQGGDNIPENIIRAIAHLTKSPGGLLWLRSDKGGFSIISEWQMARPERANDLEAMPGWLEQSQWIIDLQEWEQKPDLYETLEMPEVLTEIPRAWLIIPLMFGDHLQGILLLRESDLQPDINWEDRDLLKVAGRQAASHLAQYQASQDLVESRQFEAFNRLSAYVVHDLKNILAQQSLIVSNAQKHKSNPAFIEDVIQTVENSVYRMTNLMEQMRSGMRGQSDQQVSLRELLTGVVEARQQISPAPVLETIADDLMVEADKEQLFTVFTHMIQNAQEATAKTGSVIVRLLHENDKAVVEIEDSGSGMEEEFLRNRLFKPFDSTKGLTGMGIGAFESREFVRNLAGEIRVSSTPGVGSLFRIVLPCHTPHPENSPKSQGTTT